ncbi:hypothetical protein RIF25_13835 [Thermosynechococcaceae cyanobacterium BACA0444]|uniref:Uncharacterized protein n=1 Tax=Pseudocalidococcus azoricus BACA0444 TaxID=2918990 RepID=A0AAE4K0E5_9CYAN|nr:hypothetical protein [Pseudocalidococcus azoricus]MDS3861882.1 hypothetical protein [Pseudocalidococcus azoricus BACA0444]
MAIEPQAWVWVISQWEPHKTGLTPAEYQDGEIILQRYHTQYGNTH